MSSTHSTFDPCPLCGSSQSRTIYDMTRSLHPRDIPGWIAVCGSCHLWFKVLTAPEKVAEAYDEGYGSDDPNNELYMSGSETRRFFERVIRDLPESEQDGKRLLDIGSGMGTMLEVAGKLGFDAEGIELCETNVKAGLARGLKISLGNAQDLDRENRYDVLTMMDIIEHVPDPAALLRKAYQALRPGGQLIVYTPNHHSAVVWLSRVLERVGVTYPVYEIFGRNHICFFDDRTLRLALGQAGFEIEKMRLSPYDPRRPGASISLLNLIAVTAVEWAGMPFGRVFRMLTYARKPATAVLHRS